jgi:ribose 5-phosphate isomerase B
MRIALGADHAGVPLKADIKRLLLDRGVEIVDLGTDSTDPIDYPDIAERVGRQVGSGAVERGILLCGSGIGMAMAANKIPGVRAAPVTDEDSARLSREHNDANVLALGGRSTPLDLARRIVGLFLDTPFGGGRHRRRVDKINALDCRAADASRKD